MKAGEVNYFHTQASREHSLAMPWCEPMAFAEFAAIAAQLGSAPKCVLECGCHDGWLCMLLSKLGHTVTGMDACPEALAMASMKCPTALFAAGNFEESFLAGGYDAIIFNSAFHHSEEPLRTMQHAYMALRLGGKCILVEPGLGHTWSRFTREHARTLNVTERDTPPYRTVRLARQVGFRKWQVLPHPSTLFRTQFYAQGFAQTRPLLRVLSHFHTAIATLLCASKWLHGMVVLTK